MKPIKVAIRIISGVTGKPRTLFAVVPLGNVDKYCQMAKEYIHLNSWYFLNTQEIGTEKDMTLDWIEVKTWSFSWDSYGWDYPVAINKPTEDMEMAA